MVIVLCKLHNSCKCIAGVVFRKETVLAEKKSDAKNDFNFSFHFLFGF